MPADTPTADLPDYQPLLGAYHRAFAPELRQMIATLPISEGQSVLDMACGDGAYSALLAERVGQAGLVVAADILPAYLKRTREETGGDPRVGLAAANLDDLPFEDATFDLVWCAQSLYSLPDPVGSLRKMARVVKPGGHVAVLENDTLHHVLLPWPIEVELAVRRAELVELGQSSDEPEKFYVGRRLVEVFRDAGLEAPNEQAWASVRQAPLDQDAKTFLVEYLKNLGESVRPKLAPTMRKAFDVLTTPGSPHCMSDSQTLSYTCVDHLVCGRKPGP